MNRVANNASWIIVCRIIQSLLSLIIGTISARYLGPSNYGLITYAASVVSFVLPICQLGFNNILIRETVNNEKNSGCIFGTCITLSLITSIMCIFGIVSFAYITNEGDKDTVIVCFLYSLSLIFQTTEMIQYWFQAKLLSKYTSIVSLIAYLFFSLYKIFLLITKKGIYWFAFSIGLDYLVISILLLFLYFKKGGLKFSFSMNLGRKLFSQSKYYIISSMMVTVFSCTDKIMIKSMVNDAENGYYSVALTCSTMASFVFAAIIDSFRPIIFESKKINSAKYETHISELYSILFYLSIAQGLVLTVLAPVVIKILFGQDYSASIVLLRILPWYVGFSFFGSIRNIWLLAENKQKYLWLINLSGAVMNIAGNMLLIPPFGAIGASIVTVFTQFFTNVIVGYLIPPIRYNNTLMLKGLDPRPLIGFIKIYAQKLRKKK